MEYLTTVNKKRLSRELVGSLLLVPLYRSLYSKGPGQDGLVRVKKVIVPPAVKSFF